MKYLLFLLLIFTKIPCAGQNIDSLKQIVFGKASSQKRLTAATRAAGFAGKQNPDKVIAVAKAGLNLAYRLNDKKATALLSQTLGKAYYENNQYDSAAHYYNVAADILNKTNQQHVLTGDYNRLAKAYLQLKNYDKAIEFNKLAISYAPQTGERTELIDALNQAGSLYEAKNNYRQALNYFRQAFDIKDSLKLARQTSENTSEAYSHQFMGDVMGSIKQSLSVEEILKAIDIKKSLNDTLALSINYFNLGVLYKNKRQYEQSLDALKNSLQFAIQINYADMQRSATNELADLYEQMGNYRQSLVYLKQHANVKSSGSNTIDELQAKYEIKQREDQVLQQQFEITKRNYWMAGIGIFLLLTLFTGFFYYKQTQLKQRNIAMQAIIAAEESERRRIARDLHDSVSQTMSAAKINLAVIGGELPFINDDQRIRFEKVINLVDYGFKEVRTISHNMMPWALHKTGLEQVIKQFIENIKNDNIAINLFSRGFDSPFDDTIEIILYRVLQESVNNVMKHANANRVDISLIRSEENISLTIEDNGKGFDTTNPEVFKGMGLNNLRSRINFLKGKVEFDSQVNRGTLVSIYIPLTNKPL
ncbi:tetratricopeptide repeat protein [Mucilaginibacter sp. SMC90]|uniref:tetratricopeptide repeat-containing sensor histidine kinase n=1 Tax=Mucilaginibacter sp. SMC90 TaxID=2929803 RepID=UPI001FB267B3|nr:sensor histidine kinase [Mucilaginibacter sp. SMC90]UOE51653.1 tetratricopeptide repeat protein [Mucilaginibacter sp. SMC90]